MLTVAIPKRNKLQNIIVLTPKDGNLVQVSFLEEETIAKFQSDFRIVAEYFRSVRLGNEKETMYNTCLSELS